MLPTRTAGGGPTRRERRQGREAYAAGGGSSGRVPSVGNHPRLGRMPPTDRIRPGGPPPPAQTWWSAHRHAARRRSSGPISGSLPDESEGRRDRHSGSSCVPIAVACGHSCQRSVVRRPNSRSRVAVASGWMRRSRSRASMMCGAVQRSSTRWAAVSTPSRRTDLAELRIREGRDHDHQLPHAEHVSPAGRQGVVRPSGDVGRVDA